MSFVAAIDSPKNISTWSRACVSLAGVSDQISFSVLARSVTMLAVNSSRTTHGEMEFGQDFFKEIAFDPTDVTEEGFSDHGTTPTYSFIVSSKHLVMLLKNSDAHSLNYVCLRVECSLKTPSVRKYKLSVEMLTKKLVLKKYQISFNPVEFQRTDIPARYDMLWQENDINKFSIQTAIIKLFLDTAHALAEDFKIVTTTQNILFTAYTKQVLKDRDFLKQPMLISIQMAIDELQDSNLGDQEYSLSLRLRDFRIFIGLISTLRPDSSNLDVNSLCFDALFKDAGDPILLQSNGLDLKIKFIQMTTDESGTVAKTDPNTFVLKVPVVQKKRTLTSEPEPTKLLKKQKKRKKQKEQNGKSSKVFETEDFHPVDAFGPSLDLATMDRVTYGARSQDQLQNTFLENLTQNNGEYEETPHNDDTDYSTSGEESDTEFGPTQARDKPEPLFR